MTSGQSYMSLMIFIDPNWANCSQVSNEIHEAQSPVLFRFESTTGLEHINIQHKHLTNSSQPQAKRPMFQQKTTNGIQEIQLTLTLPLQLTEPRDVSWQETVKASLLIFMNG